MVFLLPEAGDQGSVPEELDGLFTLGVALILAGLLLAVFRRKAVM
jgi:LPXTG-motif cell wall-anchored protein